MSGNAVKVRWRSHILAFVTTLLVCSPNTFLKLHSQMENTCVYEFATTTSSFTHILLRILSPNRNMSHQETKLAHRSIELLQSNVSSDNSRQLQKETSKSTNHEKNLPTSNTSHQFLRPIRQAGKCDGCKWLERVHHQQVEVFTPQYRTPMYD